MSNLKDSGVLVNIDDNGICRIKLVGDLRYDSSAKGFIEFVNTKLTDEKISDIIIDTQDCDYIDSTNVGILGQIARIQTQKGAKKTGDFLQRAFKDLQCYQRC
jgi:anti-anti-sigma regulatory factor